MNEIIHEVDFEIGFAITDSNGTLFDVKAIGENNFYSSVGIGHVDALLISNGDKMANVYVENGKPFFFENDLKEVGLILDNYEASINKLVEWVEKRIVGDSTNNNKLI